MTKLKTILQFSYILILIYAIITINIPLKAIPNQTVQVTGIIEEMKPTEYGTNLIINGKEKYLVHLEEQVDFELGQTIKIKGIQKTPDENRNFYQFNYRLYLKSKKIDKMIKGETYQIVNSNTSIRYQLKNNILNYIDNFSSKKYLLLFIYGENALDSKQYENFQKIGIVHLFAISGMHISLFINLLKKLFPKTHSKIIIPFLLIYTSIIKLSPSVIRVVAMEVIYYLFKKRIPKKEILKGVFFLSLLYNPFYFYHLGFCFSYLISYTLTFFKKKNQFWKDLFFTSCFSFYVSIPLLINQNFELNFLTPFFNLFFIPFISYLFFPTVLLTFFFPILEVILIKEIWLLETVSNYAVEVTYFTIPFPYLKIIPFLVLFTLIIFTRKKRKFLFFTILFLIFHFHSNLFKQPALTMIDVGQGDSILFTYRHFNILIDTGGNIQKDIAKKTLIPILNSKGVHQLDYLILTHGDYDHMGAALNLIENFKVEKVIFNCGPYNDLEKELIKVLNKKKIKYYSCIKELNIDNNKLSFLQTKKYDNENDNSNVIYTKLNGYKFMFMGDASNTTEKEILNKYNLLDIDVLKVGHHGSKTSSSNEFINEINPRYSIISVGKNNRYGHPNKEVLDNLKDSKIYRTDIDGSIMFKIKNNKLKIETCSP